MKMFTTTEWEIISHRLEVPEAIADALTDAAPGEEPEVTASWESVKELADQLMVLGREGVCSGEIAPLGITVLVECCEGSTFFADMDEAIDLGEITRGKALAYRKAARSLEKKLGCMIPDA